MILFGGFETGAERWLGCVDGLVTTLTLHRAGVAVALSDFDDDQHCRFPPNLTQSFNLVLFRLFWWLVDGFVTLGCKVLPQSWSHGGEALGGSNRLIGTIVHE